MRYLHIITATERGGATLQEKVELPLPYNQLVHELGVTDPHAFLLGICYEAGITDAQSKETLEIIPVTGGDAWQLNMAKVGSIATQTAGHTYIVTFNGSQADDLPACSIRLPMPYSEIVDQLGYFHSDRLIVRLCGIDLAKVESVTVCEETQDVRPTHGEFKEVYQQCKKERDDAQPGQT